MSEATVEQIQTTIAPPDWVITGKIPKQVVEGVDAAPPKKRKRSAKVADMEALRAELEAAKQDASYWRSMAEKRATVVEVKAEIFAMIRAQPQVNGWFSKLLR